MDSNIKPILTVGIPTYNRARYLDECLGWICGEAGNNPDVEILVSDNGSTDNTEDVVNKYKASYNNVVYYKQIQNLGFDRNIKSIFDLANGEYVKPHGDDDLFTPGSINNIINIIKQNQDVSLFFVHCGEMVPATRGVGFSNFVRAVRNSNGITFLTAIIVKSETYRAIENKDRYLDSKIYHLYIEMEILRKNPNYCILGGSIVGAGSGRAGRRDYNIGEVFINSYFGIMHEYEQYGLDKDVIKEEKRYVLDWIVMPLSSGCTHSNCPLSITGLDEYFIKYYSQEEYFNERLQQIKSLL